MRIATIIISLTILSGCAHRTKPTITGLEGKPLPAFSILLHDSTSFLNTSDIPSGRATVFFLFSPECPYCKKEVQDIVANIGTLKNITFYFITSYPLAEIRAFSNYFGLVKYSNIIVGSDQTDYFQGYYKSEGVPYLVVYDKQKKMKNAFLGEVPTAEIKAIAEN